MFKKCYKGEFSVKVGNENKMAASYWHKTHLVYLQKSTDAHSKDIFYTILSNCALFSFRHFLNM